jgi:hypothetical protein
MNLSTLSFDAKKVSGANNLRNQASRDISNQEKDIELERLKTTCQNLNNQLLIQDDIK